MGAKFGAFRLVIDGTQMASRRVFGNFRSKSVLGAHHLGRKLPNDPYGARRTLLEGDLRKQAAHPSALHSFCLLVSMSQIS